MITLCLANWPTKDPTAPAAPFTTQTSPAFGSNIRRPKYAVNLFVNKRISTKIFFYSYPGIPSTPSETEGERESKSNGIGRRSLPSFDK